MTGRFAGTDTMTWTLDDRYRLTNLVARGEKGEVWRAVDDGTGRPVAVKLLRPQLAADRRLADRLQRARRALSELWHPGIARLIDVVVTADLVALVADFVPGTDLAHLLVRSGPLPPARAARIAATLADALAAAHRAGVVHGDVKPSNVILPAGAGEAAQLTDFSLATLVRVGRQDAEWASTSRYGAPEVVEGAVPTPSSDVHALGVVLYEMVTGTTVREGHAGAGVDPHLLDIIDGCLCGEQASRLSAEDVSRRLRELVPRLDGPARAEPPEPAPRPPVWSQAPRPRPAAGGPRSDGGPAGPRHAGVAFGGVVVVAAVVVAGALVVVDALSVSSSASPSPAFAPTILDTSADVPVPPSAAAVPTREGGSEFVRYWFTALTFAVTTGDTAAVVEATSPDCVECQRAIAAVESGYADGGSLRGGGYVVRGVSTADLWSGERPVYDATVDRGLRTMVDAAGTVRDTLSPLSFANCVVVLEWTDEQWRLREVVSPGCVS